MNHQTRIASVVIAAWFAVGLLVLSPTVAGAQGSAGAAFTRITTGDIVTLPATYWNGAWGDYDDDGWLDLFVGANANSTRNYFYHNERDGTFRLADDAAMPKVASSQHGAAWGDYDNDGHLDLFVTAGNPGTFHNALYRNNGNGTFSPVTTGPIYTGTYPSGFHSPSWGDYDNDGFLDLFIVFHEPFPRLYRNNGDGSFTRVTHHVLVSRANGAPGRAWVDYDNDGDLDLFLGPGSGTPYSFFRNDGAGVFTSVRPSGLTNPRGDTYGVCWADYDNDGFPDLFLSGAPTNLLYHNNRDGTFTSITDSAVVADTIPSNEIFSSCAWGDYDNDGFLDLFVTAADPAGDATSHDFLYHNAGDGAFTKVTDGAVVTDHIISSGASWGDYDNDGFLDLFVSQGAFAPDPLTNVLYHNDGNANAWLNVKLVGTVSNRSAIGAKVRVNASYRGESRWQLRDVSGGDSGSNQQSLNAEFGLADAAIIDTVRVEWPSGAVQEVHDVVPRQFLTITEPFVAPVEICGNCLDDDHNGLVDFEDPACCAPGGTAALAVRKARFTPASRKRTFDLKAGVEEPDMGLPGDDLFVQLRQPEAREVFCAHLPGAQFTSDGAMARFADATHAIPGALGIDKATLRRLAAQGTRLAATSSTLGFPVDPQVGSTRITLGFRSPLSGTGRCAGADISLRSGPRQMLRFP